MSHVPNDRPIPMAAMRWETATRYYISMAQQDLFGHWELVKIWGAKASGHGRCQFTPMTDLPSCLAALQAIEHQRALRGYRDVPMVGARPSPDHP